MGRKPIPPENRRDKINISVHPDILEWAKAVSHKRRRSISQLFEELVEAEWRRRQAATPYLPPPPPAPHHFHPPSPYPYAPLQAPPSRP